MRNIISLLVAVAVLQACTGKKTETTETADSVQVDTTSALADQPAPASLAFDQIAGYTIKNTVALSDSVNVFLIADEDEFDKMFAADKGASPAKPDFLINYVIGIACLTTDRATTIVLDNVTVADAIVASVTLKRGEKQSVTYKPTQILVFERRNVLALNVLVNGKTAAEFIVGE